ncbi:MAG: hypothetical protein JRI68_17885 [Deltaproteobacteria bacterium]|nr:hypothetical protein [Deltaproteobacteria bacterium]
MNRTTTILAAACLPLALAGAPQIALAQDSDGPSASEEIGLNLDVGFATAYVFRGWNMFQKASQMDPHMLFAPGAAWAIGESGVTIAYWSAYQITGSNSRANTDGALNVEQDLIVSYDLELGSDVGLSFALASYMYPAADPVVMGTAMPVYLDPMVALSYAAPVDLRLAVSYFAGVQDEPYIWGNSYLYLNPSVGKSWELDEHVGLDLALGYGLKVPNEGMEGRDNIHDVTLTAATPIHPGGPSAYVTPSIGLGWTNVEDVTDEETSEVIDDKGFGDGFVLWAAVNLGLDI